MCGGFNSTAAGDLARCCATSDGHRWRPTSPLRPPCGGIWPKSARRWKRQRVSWPRRPPPPGRCRTSSPSRPSWTGHARISQRDEISRVNEIQEKHRVIHIPARRGAGLHVARVVRSDSKNLRFSHNQNENGKKNESGLHKNTLSCLVLALFHFFVLLCSPSSAPLVGEATAHGDAVEFGG